MGSVPYISFDQIFKYNGIGPIHEESFENLYDAVWRPAAEGVFPDRPPSPRKGTEDDSAIAVKQSEPVKVAGIPLFGHRIQNV